MLYYVSKSTLRFAIPIPIAIEIGIKERLVVDKKTFYDLEQSSQQNSIKRQAKLTHSVIISFNRLKHQLLIALLYLLVDNIDNLQQLIFQFIVSLGQVTRGEYKSH